MLTRNNGKGTRNGENKYRENAQHNTNSNIVEFHGTSNKRGFEIPTSQLPAGERDAAIVQNAYFGAGRDMPMAEITSPKSSIERCIKAPYSAPPAQPIPKPRCFMKSWYSLL